MLFTALTSAEIFLWLFSINRSNNRLFADVADPILSQALPCILPAIATIVIFALVKMGAAEANIQDIYAYFYVQVEEWFSAIGKQVQLRCWCGSVATLDP